MKLYGTDHLYNGDPFNEMNPPSNDPSYLAQVSKSIYEGLAESDPNAVWVLQGWFLYASSSFWYDPNTYIQINYLSRSLQ